MATTFLKDRHGSATYVEHVRDPYLGWIPHQIQRIFNAEDLDDTFNVLETLNNDADTAEAAMMGLTLARARSYNWASGKATSILQYNRFAADAFISRPRPTAWSRQYMRPMRRFVAADGSIIEDSDTEVAHSPHGQPAVIMVPVPCDRIYRLTTTTTTPTSLDSGNGTFVAITGYDRHVMQLGRNVVEYAWADGSLVYDVITIYEHRAADPTDGWEEHSLGPDGKVLITSLYS